MGITGCSHSVNDKEPMVRKIRIEDITGYAATLTILACVLPTLNLPI